MIKVISFKICPFFQYVTAMLEATNTPYKVEYADFDNCLFELSPNGKAPILITDSKGVLFDADAIVSYLDSLYEGLYKPNTKDKSALIEAWANYGSKNYVPQCNTMRSASETEYQSNLVIFNKSLINVERQIGEHTYFMGDQLSRVDIAWLPLLYRAHLIEKHTKVDFLAQYPKVKAWQKTMLSLDIAEKSVSSDFEKIFVDFYLSSGYLTS
jgi:glutathione S-transferase